MILLDASVLIEFLRHRDQRLEEALDELDLGVCGITRAEILHGARDPSDEQRLLYLFNQFNPVQTPENIWDDLGRSLYALRRQGIIVPISDAIVATIAVRNSMEVWSMDRHFPLMKDVLGLKLFHSPLT